MGRGPFKDITGQASVTDIAASAQSFVAISAVTAVAFSVAMIHLRDSLRKIRNNEVQLGQLLDSASGTAFIATDLEGIITWFSPGAEQLLGYSAEDIVSRTTPMPFHESREILSRAQKLRITPGYEVVTHPVAHGADQDTRDWTYVRKDGSRLTVSVSVTAVRGVDGNPVSFLSVVRDVTDRRAAEQALVFALDKERETNQRMLDLDRAKGEFVSAVSHELRTPLTSIVGYTELLAEDMSENLTEEQQQLVERIDRNGERLLTLVEDLLTMARVEDGNLALERVEIDMRSPVRVATDEVAHSAHKGRVSLTVDLPSEPVTLEGDQAYLERLVLNLVSNAVKFTDAGGEVDVTLRTIGDVAELCVHDTGMGIPLEEQSRLFQKFFRSSLATEHAIQGTGLGLNIVRSIAEAHHGEVRFQSAPGEGTTFWFTVPLGGTPGGVPVDRATPSATTRTSTHAPAGAGRAAQAPQRLRGASLEVEPRLDVTETLGRDGVDVSFAEHDVELPADLDLGLVVGVEEHPVTDLDGAHVRPDGDDAAPGQPAAAHGRRGRDQDAAAGTALAGVEVDRDQHPVVQHLDRGLLTCRLGDLGDAALAHVTILRTTTNRATTPTTPPATLTMLSVRGAPLGSTKKPRIEAISRRTMVLGLVR